MESLTVMSQVNKYDTLSNSYKVVNTQELLTKLEDRGFTLDKLVVNKTRVKAKQGYQKHRLVLNHSTLLDVGQVDGNAQLLVTNSYDGTSGIIFQLGFFRMVCANGLVVGKNFSTVSLRHTGIDLDKKIDNAIIEIAAQAQKLKSVISAMKNRQLSATEVKQYELSAAIKRTELSNIIEVVVPINRAVDHQNDLFTVFNRIQESAIRGGMEISYIDKDNKFTIAKTRAIRGISSSTKINKDLFDLAESFLQVA